MLTSQLRLQRLGDRADRIDLGGKLVAVAGAAVAAYGVVFVIIDLTSFIEIGLSPQLVGGDASTIQAFSPALLRFISHLQLNLAAFILAFGCLLTATAWFGIRRGERWAIWSALLTYLLGLAVGLPIHYVYGLATWGHVGPFYLVTALVVVGCLLARSGLAEGG